MSSSLNQFLMILVNPTLVNCCSYFTLLFFDFHCLYLCFNCYVLSFYLFISNDLILLILIVNYFEMHLGLSFLYNFDYLSRISFWFHFFVLTYFLYCIDFELPFLMISYLFLVEMKILILNVKFLDFISTYLNNHFAYQ